MKRLVDAAIAERTVVGAMPVDAPAPFVPAFTRDRTPLDSVRFFIERQREHGRDGT